jgi:hypothetical protein
MEWNVGFLFDNDAGIVGALAPYDGAVDGVVCATGTNVIVGSGSGFGFHEAFFAF